MPQRRDRTTVIFLNENQNYSKPWQVKTYYIKHWKKFAAALLIILCILIGVIMQLIKSRAEIQLANQNLALLLEKHKNESAQLDTSAIKQHYLSIDDKL